jgi:hypothetical protein
MGYKKDNKEQESIFNKLKDNAKKFGWVWDETFGGNLCPSCQEQIKEERQSKS